jgi:hypothetical protein
LEGRLDWPGSTVECGDAIDIVARLKEESEVPLRSHCSLSLKHALMVTGLVDRIQLTRRSCRVAPRQAPLAARARTSAANQAASPDTNCGHRRA